MSLEKPFISSFCKKDGLVHLSIVPGVEVSSRLIHWPSEDRMSRLDDHLPQGVTLLFDAPVEFVIFPGLVFEKWERTFNAVSAEAGKRNFREPLFQHAGLLGDALRGHQENRAKDAFPRKFLEEMCLTRVHVMHEPIRDLSGNHYVLSIGLNEPPEQLTARKKNNRSWVSTVAFAYRV